MMLYMACNRRMPIISYDKQNPSFYVEELSNQDNEFFRNAYNKFLKIFPDNYIYKVCAHSGCGCGFSYGINPIYDEDDIEEENECKISTEKLIAYLKSNIQSDEEIKLYSCITGNEMNQMDSIRTLKVSQMELGKQFKLNNRELMKIIK